MSDSPIDEGPVGLKLAANNEALPRTQWQLFLRRFLRHRPAVGSSVVLFIVTIACFMARFFPQYDLGTTNLSLIGLAEGPSWRHWMGTTDLGQDHFSQILEAGQISLRIGFFVALISTTVGVVLGSAAGYYGGFVDRVLSATTDGFLVVPQIAMLAVLLKYFGQTPTVITLVLAGLGWTYVARVSRGQVLALKEKEFVEAARSVGASGPRIVARHILPNMVGPIMVNLTLSVAAAIVTESTLSFLGLGVQPPITSWGRMLTENRGAINDPSKMHLLLFPGLMLLIVIMCVNFVGDGLRDGFDPQAKHTA